MRNLRLLLLLAAVAAVGSYSAFAGPDRPSHTGPSTVASQAGNDVESGPLAVQEQQPEDGQDPQGNDKVAAAIAGEFNVSTEEVLARHDQGIGFGALFKLYKLARARGISVDEMLATVPKDTNGEFEFGFGKLRKALTPEQRALYESGPKNLGRLVSGGKGKPGNADGEAETESGTETAGNSGRVPPGQAKKATRR
jgi:hypothetical protein